VTAVLASVAAGDLWADAWRILLSFFALVGLTAFWFYAAPRLGVPGHEAVRTDDAAEVAGPLHPRFESLHRGTVRLAIVFTVIIFAFCSISYYAAFRWGFGYSP
jgi:hypothetical protein